MNSDKQKLENCLQKDAHRQNNEPNNTITT